LCKKAEKGKMNDIKYLKLLYAEKLAAVPIWEVAKIAAMLLRDGTSLSSDEAVKRADEKDPLVAATAKAFELLEIAYYGKRGLMD
jgi:hypothetical protein